MHSVAVTVFGVEWEFFKPYIVIGLATGGAYALSGVGIVVLYQATGVLNLAFGAIGAAGALISYWIIAHHPGVPEWLALGVCIAFGGVVTFLYGVVLGPAFARREPLVKMMGTLALALILLGLMQWRAPQGGAFFRVLELPTSAHRYELLGATVSLTQVLALAFAIVLTDRHDAVPQVHEARHRLPGGRHRPRDHRDTRRTGPAGRGLGVARQRRSCAEPPGCCSPTSSRRSTTRRCPSTSSSPRLRRL